MKGVAVKGHCLSQVVSFWMQRRMPLGLKIPRLTMPVSLCSPYHFVHEWHAVSPSMYL